MLAASCTGCMLLPHRYYAPSADEGVMLRNQCWRTDETILFQRGGVQAAVGVVRREDDRWLELSIAIPGGHVVRVDDRTLALIDDADDERRFIARFTGVATVQSPSAHMQPVHASMKGETLGATGLTGVRQFWLYAPVDLERKDRFTVVLPALDIDGRRQELPVVRFVRTTRWQFVAPFRC